MKRYIILFFAVIVLATSTFIDYKSTKELEYVREEVCKNRLEREELYSSMELFANAQVYINSEMLIPKGVDESMSKILVEEEYEKMFENIDKAYLSEDPVTNYIEVEDVVVSYSVDGFDGVLIYKNKLFDCRMLMEFKMDKNLKIYEYTELGFN